MATGVTDDGKLRITHSNYTLGVEGFKIITYSQLMSWGFGLCSENILQLTNVHYYQKNPAQTCWKGEREKQEKVRLEKRKEIN